MYVWCKNSAAKALARPVVRAFRDYAPDKDAADIAERELLSLLSSYVNA